MDKQLALRGGTESEDVMDEKLVEEMCEAFGNAPCDDNCGPHNCSVLCNRRGMTAALRVARKAIAEHEAARWEKALRSIRLWAYYSLGDLIAEIRARLAPEPTAQEQVEAILYKSLGHAAGTYAVPNIAAKIVAAQDELQKGRM